MSRPTYVSRLGVGELSVTPPGVFTGCRAMIFSATGNRSAMQRFAASYLETPTDGAVSVIVPGSRFFLYFFNADRLSSPAEPMGWTPNREFSLAFPVILRFRGHPLRTRLAMWAPYVIIDNARGMVTGRESWGWFKGLGEVRSPRDPAVEGPDSTVSTLIFPRFDPNAQGRTAPLVQVRSRAGGIAPSVEAVDPAAGRLESFGEHLVELMAGAVEEGEEFAALSRDWLANLMPAVNLKQFRDAADPTLACHQSITTCPLKVTSLRGLGMVRGDLDIEFTPCVSHRIVDQLGLSGPVLPAGPSLAADLDYETAGGETLWSA